ncbi:enoyl-CoA hydratase/isomerase family protein [Phenylobacterium aquaticum]|uniref:enoyl-CoA hydratase/isomerase family protein n=1 Tax=Phenylobacterium aquaticum TaxID=1763816 RepID=UPI0026EBA00D|nr:enoyl-CoA hydratase-related protein [Phenylobacterium aquaticum]
MSEPILKVADEGRVRILTLNRPAQLNSMSDALYDAVGHALNLAAADPGVAVVILTGEGRAFCAGQDLAEMENRPTYPPCEVHGFGPFMDALDSFEKPLIAAVNGLGVGIGLTLLPYCDFVFMDEGARLRAPFVTLGVTAEAGSTALLPALVGWSNTADIVYTGRWIDAPTAVAMGLAREVAPAGTVLDRARAQAALIAPNPIVSLVATKRLLIHARLDAARAARAREDAVFRGLEGGPANLEALAAFREKRPADFSKL